MSTKLKVDVKREKDYVVLYTEGYINNIGGEEISKQFNILYEEGYKKYVLNLKGTSIINSIGISILIEIIEKLVSEKGKLNFCNLTPVIARTFEIMGLAQYTKIYDSEEEAISNL